MVTSTRFGDCIIIERRISRGSGGGYWKVLNQAGKVVSDHKPAEVLRHLGINAANPLTIITQDMARAFLSGEGPCVWLWSGVKGRWEVVTGASSRWDQRG